MNGFLDLLFPPRCPACRALLRSEEGFCASCACSLLPMPERRCGICALPQIDGYCGECRREPPPFERVDAGFLHGGAVAEAIHRFKYQNAPQCAEGLAEAAWAEVHETLEWAELLVPIALHSARLRERGYNQAALLAGAWAKRARRPRALAGLERIRETPHQVGQGRLAREENLVGAFRAEPSRVSGRRIGLVDDVFTTGATARAASIALRDAGAVAVRVIVVARAP